MTADTTEGSAPLTVQFTSTRHRPGGPRLRYAWDFDANGTWIRKQANPSHTYTEDGVYRATLQVTDQAGRYRLGLRGDHRRPAAGGRTSPSRPMRAAFQFGDTVQYTVP